MAEDMFVAESADFGRLREQGFTEAEVKKLAHMKEHVGEQVEYREMLEEQHRLDFIRWLVQHDRISK